MHKNLPAEKRHILFFFLFIIFITAYSSAVYGRKNKAISTADTLIFHLPDVIVTAIESKEMGSTSLLPASTIEHVQPISIADLTQLLPGGLTVNSRFKYPQAFTVREITFNNGGNRIQNSAAEGMQIIIDGSPFYHNADINSPFAGYDSRFLSMNEVEWVEVTRGIPSAQYGNLTNGILKMKTRTGEMPLTLGLRYNPYLKQYSAGKGFRISPLGHTLNVLADYTTEGEFHTGGLRLANQYNWIAAGKPLIFDLSYTTRIGKEKIFITENEHSEQKRQDHRLTLGGEWKPGRHLLQSLSLRMDISASLSSKDEVRGITERVSTEAIVSGEWVAHVPPEKYHDRLLTEELPLYAEVEVIASTNLPLTRQPGSRVELKTGASWRSEGNRGKGIQFDIRMPPDGISRPRSYRDIPFLHSASFFAEALFRWPRFTAQTGMRYQATASRDYPLMGSAEPRLNLSWTAFNSSRWRLRLKAGAGLMGHMPTVNRLYPAPVYTDRTSFLYNDPEGGNSLAIVSVHAPGNIKSADLRPTINRKLEAGFSLETPAVRLDMTGFYERQTGGFTTADDFLPFSYREYEYLYDKGLRPTYKNGQVLVNGQPVPYEEKADFTQVTRPVNATLTRKQGVEMTADFGTFAPLRTSVIVDGMWLRIRRSNNALTGFKESYDVDGMTYPLAGFYDKVPNQAGNQWQTEQLSTNFRFITRIPKIGVVTTLTWQMIWMYKDRTRYNGDKGEESWPLYWCGADGIRHPFTDTEREDPLFAPLMRKSRTYAFEQNTYKPYGLLNLRASKEFSRLITLSFFVNNLANMRPSRFQSSSEEYYAQNPAPFFGLEMQVKL